ncbi:MAG TPA: asparagine synthase (glutamine-hydrolyzing) [Candidatus Butyricicoccus stercorigallinarum]|nr:asparagine synthase (glutamine-hydrolyzing) [Candidatus Butyricicoccus stercorigallinarum]
MCGIAGLVGDVPSRGVLERMQRTMRRRGPDQTGLWQGEGAALLHARLAVIDIEGGRQPMTRRAGQAEYVIVYNGELYNTGQLRGELEACGHRFATHSDTEVLLASYVEWGEACLEKLNGIYAFAVWNTREQTLFFARDRIGVKPLFFAEAGGSFLFASEIKTLLAHPGIDAHIDADAVAELMLVGPGRTPGYGVFCGIREVQAGWCGTYSRRGGVHLRQYWALHDREHTDNTEETVARVRALVCDAVARQLVSDVPLCTFLSGGLDSSILSAIAARAYAAEGRRLHTVSVTYRDNDKYFQASHFQPNSDDAFIARMNEAIGAENHLVVIDTPQLVRALFEAVEARDLPGMADVDASLLLFCREIKKIGTVALSGECADEIFGGYPWYRDAEVRRRQGFPWAQSTAYRASFLRDEWRERIDAAAYIDERYQRTIAGVRPVRGDEPDDRRIREMTRLNMQWFMQTLLDRKDRMSMFSGLEVRVPFCDHRIAEYLYNVPWHQKDLHGMEKGLLREAVRGLLPEEIRTRKKSPYPKTHNPSYLRAVSNLLRQVLDEGTSPMFDFVKKEALEQLLCAQRAQPWYGQLMQTPQTIAYFLQLHHWMALYHVTLR